MAKKPPDKLKNVFDAMWYIEYKIRHEHTLGQDILLFVLGQIDNPKLSELKAFLKSKRVKFTKDGKIEIPE